MGGAHWYCPLVVRVLGLYSPHLQCLSLTTVTSHGSLPFGGCQPDPPVRSPVSCIPLQGNRVPRKTVGPYPFKGGEQGRTFSLFRNPCSVPAMGFAKYLPSVGLHMRESGRESFHTLHNKVIVRGAWTPLGSGPGPHEKQQCPAPGVPLGYLPWLLTTFSKSYSLMQ